MPIQYRKRIPLITREQVSAWLNLSTGWPSISVRVGRLIFNTKRAFSSVRLGRGFSYRDKD
jgi:hypothetical protein